MPRSRAVAFAVLALALLALSLLVSRWPALNGDRPAPTPWNTPTPVSAVAPNSNGAMVRANVHGTGVYVTQGVPRLTGLQWKFQADERGQDRTPARQGDTVYFAHDGRVYAVDARTGTAQWHLELEISGTSAPAVAGDRVYVGAWEE